MKYVRHRQKGFILFEDSLVHYDVGHFLGMDGIFSAGFVSFDEKNKPVCWGKSVSLDIGSRPDDTEFLTKQLQGY